jgi:hypothetical protein
VSGLEHQDSPEAMRRDIEETERRIATEGKELPAFAAGELRRLASTLEQMPAPRGDQPREFDLGVRVPRLGIEVVVGVCRWNPSILEWTWQAALPTTRAGSTLDYPFREGQEPPAGVVERRRS